MEAHAEGVNQQLATEAGRIRSFEERLEMAQQQVSTVAIRLGTYGDPSFFFVIEVPLYPSGARGSGWWTFFFFFFITPV